MSANDPLNSDEKNRLFMTLDSHTRILDRQTEIADRQSKQLEKFDRALFGDQQIDHAGIVKDVSEMKKWIARYTLKLTFAAGGFTVVGFLLKMAWEYATRK